MKYYLSKIIELNFAQTLAKVTDELKKEGFGIITTIDMKETFREKLGKDFKPYTILGACNPNLAFEAVQQEDRLGSLLPCNVVVIGQSKTHSEVVVMDAPGIMEEFRNEKLQNIAEEVGNRMERVLDNL